MKIIKEGGESIILGTGYISIDSIKTYNLKSDKLLRITKKTQEQTQNHNHNHNHTYNTEHQIYEIIKSIPNNLNMYSIPNTNPIEIDKKDAFHQEIEQLIKKHKYTTLNPLPETILMYEIPYAGEYELIDTIKRIDIKSIKIRPSIKNIPKIWNSYNDIINFGIQIITALKYLHINKIAHLDIKAENIMVDLKTTNNINQNQFRLIDFGYSSIYPFTDYIKNMKGTPDYFPQHFKDLCQPTDYLPKITSNDTEVNPVTNKINLFTRIEYIYKIDSYCLGRVLQFLRYFYQQYYERHLLKNKKNTINPNKLIPFSIIKKLFGSSKSKNPKQQPPKEQETQKEQETAKEKLNKLIEKLLNDNIHQRYYIKDIEL